MRIERKTFLFGGGLLALLLPLSASAQLVASGLEGAQGSAMGPDRALYVTEGAAGRISRIDLKTGNRTTFTSGLPPALLPVGGVVDVAFIGHTAYALVTMVTPELGGNSIAGIYRIDGPDSYTIIADIGEFSRDNPPDSPFFLPVGVQYALDVWRGCLLVTDGHLNRVLQVSLDGEISVLAAFDNNVPTGLAVRGNRIFMGQAGAVPHVPEDGKILSIRPRPHRSPIVRDVAAGAPLLVDVERRGGRLYALAQGIWDGAFEGSPALPFTGSLLRVAGHGTMEVVATGLNQPTSLEIVGKHAYYVTLGGEVWKLRIRGGDDDDHDDDEDEGDED